mgnify:CR=1 FL=1
MKRFSSLFVFLFLLMTAMAKPIDVRQVMVRFDQAFIPLWFSTELGDLDNARSTVAYTEFRWQQMERTLRLLLPEGEWTLHLDRTEDWLTDAYWAVQRGDLAMAAIELDHARFEMMAMRRQLGIMDYYPDQLYQLHSSLDILAEISEDPKLCLLDWNEFARLVEQAQTDWITLRDRQIDAQVYDLAADQINELNRLADDLEEAMDRLTQRMHEAQRLEVAGAINAADAVLIQCIRLFGQFDTTSVLFADPRQDDGQKATKTF